MHTTSTAPECLVGSATLVENVQRSEVKAYVERLSEDRSED